MTIQINCVAKILVIRQLYISYLSVWSIDKGYKLSSLKLGLNKFLLTNFTLKFGFGPSNFYGFGFYFYI